MRDKISAETFNHLVDLAALELTPAESQYLLEQMNNQLNAIHELELIPLDEQTPPARHGIPFPRSISPALRDDRIENYPAVSDIISQAPSIEDRYIIVPDIPHTELE